MKTFLISALALTAGLGVGSGRAADFDLNALIEAAKAEPPLTVYDSTGKITEMADAFAAKYGLQATGTKTKATAQLETIIREVQSGNVQTDVSFISDVPAAMGQLLPGDFAESWLPPDLAADISPEAQNPLLIVSSPNVLTYNTKLFDKCPITNIWQLTEPEWKGKVSMQDPLGKPSYTDWFNQMRSHADDRIAAAYEAKYGKKLDAAAASATEAFVAALAANGPLLTDSDSAAAEAVAAPGQTQPFVGLVSAAKFRDNDGAGFTLGLCDGVDPIIGFSNATVGLIVKGTDSPNAAKLFVHYAMTAEGIAPQAEDGKLSSNKTVGLPADEPSGVGAHLDKVLPYDPSTGVEDWDTRQDWQDLWRLNYKR
ncbi:ABC transporter substrate-binding protein [Paracoccus sp. CPCC 101403]|uniref:ABC transporter substrate-binding protein n=1 Tax=Paracoccus broussonetiae TaxID=3075834 RepID=A0ABU3EHR7_9RHOB|nr:ABC transporter substrate-binding protein [Paracoccus sp. CPCC 101403]MDT1063796.1 ABC transporter substrate-binding protein [Paracoccus sp. CPCC 101403]